MRATRRCRSMTSTSLALGYPERGVGQSAGRPCGPRSWLAGWKDPLRRRDALAGAGAEERLTVHAPQGEIRRRRRQLSRKPLSLPKDRIRTGTRDDAEQRILRAYACDPPSVSGPLTQTTAGRSICSLETRGALISDHWRSLLTSCALLLWVTVRRVIRSSSFRLPSIEVGSRLGP